MICILLYFVCICWLIYWTWEYAGYESNKNPISKFYFQIINNSGNWKRNSKIHTKQSSQNKISHNLQWKGSGGQAARQHISVKGLCLRLTKSSIDIAACLYPFLCPLKSAELKHFERQHEPNPEFCQPPTVSCHLPRNRFLQYYCRN